MSFYCSQIYETNAKSINIIKFNLRQLTALLAAWVLFKNYLFMSDNFLNIKFLVKIIILITY